VEEVAQSGFADFASTDLQAVVEGAELVILCTPIGVMGELSRAFSPSLAPGALVTDVGSVKGPVVADLQAIFGGSAHFVGSHPMAGSEQTGWSAARADLFQRSVCIVTPSPQTDGPAVQAITAFWESVGCSVRLLGPEEHDEVVAFVSHLPHLLAATLVAMVAEQKGNAFDFSGPGFRDTTRIAGGPPAMWTEILQSNRAAVRKSAEAMIEKLREIVTLLDRDSPDATQRMNQFLTEAKVHRDQLRRPL
jgi:prephenate dehydrogenase